MLGHVRCNYCCMNHTDSVTDTCRGIAEEDDLKRDTRQRCISHLETLGMMPFLKVVHAGVQNG